MSSSSFVGFFDIIETPDDVPVNQSQSTQYNLSQYNLSQSSPEHPHILFSNPFGVSYLPDHRLPDARYEPIFIRSSQRYDYENGKNENKKSARVNNELIGCDDNTFEEIICRLISQSEPVIDDSQVEHFKHYECIICQHIAIHYPVQHIKCGGLFCENCIAKWLSKNQSCPLCREPAQMSCITDDSCSTIRKMPISVRSHLANVRVKCPIDKCEKVFDQAKLKQHLISECIIHCESCEDKTTLDEMRKHICEKLV